MAKSATFPKILLNILKSFTSDEDASLPKLLFGRYSNSNITVTACLRCPSLYTEDVSESIQKGKLFIPEGNEVIGICIHTSDKEDRKKLVKNCMDILKSLSLETRIVVCVSQSPDGLEISDVWMCIDQDEPVKLDFTISDEPSLSDMIIGRTRFLVPLTFTHDKTGTWKSVVHNEIEKVIEDINNGSMLYHLDHSKVLLSCEDCNNIDDNVACDKLFKYIEEEEEGGRPMKKASKKSVRCLNFTGYTDMSRSQPSETIPTCAPIINYKTGAVDKVSMSLGINVVTLLEPNLPVKDIADRITRSVIHQLQAAENCICEFSQNNKFITPVACHYQPLNLLTLITVMMPQSVPEQQLVNYRREIHKFLCLPDDRPLFRRRNQFIFPGAGITGGYLVNVHEGITGGSKVAGGTSSLVSGFYTYHHYMQDRFDDNKWGCAYRSLQTLASWFKLQGYTDRDVPTHREIQQTLVDIGDKEKKFVGSRQWIGSMEVSFVLETLLGVSCKILSVSSGADMASKGRELSSHFATQGTPVMIGGGVLAHTILGVDYNEVTGDIAFLILDPHYTGSEDKKAILDMGWCGWKGPEFWEKHAHYNMCLPQRPNVI